MLIISRDGSLWLVLFVAALFHRNHRGGLSGGGDESCLLVEIVELSANVALLLRVLEQHIGVLRVAEGRGGRGDAARGWQSVLRLRYYKSTKE